MKPIMLLQSKAGRWFGAALLGLNLPAFALLAADTNAPQAAAPAPQTNAPVAQTNAPAPQATAPIAQTNAPAAPAAAPAPLTPEQTFEGGAKAFNNWIDLSAGGFISSGNKAQLLKALAPPSNVCS